MAITASHLTTGALVATQSSWTTDSVSPVAGQLAMVAVFNSIAAGTPTIPTISGGGMTTWDQVGTHTALTRRMTFFRAMQGSVSSGAITIDYGGVNQNFSGWSVVLFDGVQTSGTNGENAIVQFSGNSTDGNTTGITVTLGAFANSGNGVFGVARRNGSSNAVTPGSGFTQLGTATANGVLTSMWRNDNDTSVDWTWPAETGQCVAAAVELAIFEAAPAAVAGRDNYAYFM